MGKGIEDEQDTLQDKQDKPLDEQERLRDKRDTPKGEQDILLDEPEKVARIAVKTRKDYSIVRIGEDNHEMLPDKYDRLQDMKNG
jgi:hypothetical protein